MLKAWTTLVLQLVKDELISTTLYDSDELYSVKCIIMYELIMLTLPEWIGEIEMSQPEGVCGLPLYLWVYKGWNMTLV